MSPDFESCYATYSHCHSEQSFRHRIEMSNICYKICILLRFFVFVCFVGIHLIVFNAPEIHHKSSEENGKCVHQSVSSKIFHETPPNYYHTSTFCVVSKLNSYIIRVNFLIFQKSIYYILGQPIIVLSNHNITFRCFTLRSSKLRYSHT